MANPSKEDIEWFRSTFHPIPKPKLPDDCVEYSIYVLPSSPSRSSKNQLEVRSRLREVQKASSELVKTLLKDYIWQRESFGLELTSEDGNIMTDMGFVQAITANSLSPFRVQPATRTDRIWRFGRGWMGCCLPTERNNKEVRRYLGEGQRYRWGISTHWSFWSSTCLVRAQDSGQQGKFFSTRN